VALPDLVARVGPFDALLDRWFEAAAGRDFVTQMTLVDLTSYLPGDILTKVDRASMSASLEARVPLLDHPLVEFAVSLPSHLKLRDGTGKWIFRRAIAGLVPESVLTKPKQGFGIPLGRWFRRELRHRLKEILSPSAANRAFVEPRRLGQLAREHLIGRRDHSALLWRVLVLERWLYHLASGSLAQPLPVIPAVELVREARAI
jgi:asparagine synthase (glutamine-hydrolysing)